MKKCCGILAGIFFFAQQMICANSINLFNDTPYMLKAIIYDANENMLGEFVLNPRDATVWTDDQGEFGTEIADASQTPYSVNWFCMSGNPYGVCTDVAAGSVVTAQSCGGAQQCSEEQVSQ